MKLSMTVYSSPLVSGGAKRLARLLSRHTEKLLTASKCPSCNGPIQADDDGGVVRKNWRYSIGCKDDCASVSAPSVKMAVELWVSVCRKGKP